MLFWWICGGESVLPVLLLCHLGSSPRRIFIKQKQKKIFKTNKKASFGSAVLSEHSLFILPYPPMTVTVPQEMHFYIPGCQWPLVPGAGVQHLQASSRITACDPQARSRLGLQGLLQGPFWLLLQSCGWAGLGGQLADWLISYFFTV